VIDVRTNHDLPSHGHITCRRCFPESFNVQTIGNWQIVNDPGAWGSAKPEILLLGFSKGFTQASAYVSARFEDVPFKGMRARLSDALRVIRILAPHEGIDEKFSASESRFAFGSLVRCSLSRRNDKTGRLECTGQVMAKAFREEVAQVIQRCAGAFTVHFPASLRLVLMLGTTDAYVSKCKALIRTLHGDDYSEVNEIGYRTRQVHWAHISHPSPLNGHHADWVEGDVSTKAGRKRLLAEDIVRLSGVTVA